MVLMIDNYDSFTWNLVQYFGELGEEVRVVRNDDMTLAALEKLEPEAIVVSPGLLGYVLPGMTVRWPLEHPADTAGPGAKLTARINGTPVDQAFAVGDLPR